jgi:hypothetical protein
MKRWTYWVLPVMVILLADGSAFTEEVRGIIKKVDLERRELHIETLGLGKRGLPMMFRLTNETRLTLNGQPAAMADVPTGVRARIDYEIRDGQRQALGISVRELLRRPEPARTDENRVVGTISRISFTEREIVVIGPGRNESTFVIPEHVSITKEKKAIKLDDLREGERVIVFTQVRDGKMEVASVVAGSGDTPPMPNAPRIEQLRKIMRLADLFLDQMAKQKAPPDP